LVYRKVIIVMRKYFFVGIGGSSGALLRYIIKDLHVLPLPAVFPWGTFLVNIAGAFILGFVMSAVSDTSNAGGNLKLVLTVGLAGALTTFSAFCQDIVCLLQSGHILISSSYLLISVIFGSAAVIAGEFIGGYISSGKTENEQIRLENSLSENERDVI